MYITNVIVLNFIITLHPKFWYTDLLKSVIEKYDIVMG